MEDRRRFLGALLTVPLVGGGLARPTIEKTPPAAAPTDAELFASLRGEFLFPRDVTYCNTGTLGAMPREVLDAMVNGLRNTEASLPDWPYFQADGEPLTGYQPLLAARTAAARFLGAEADEVAITQNATMGMNALGNGIDWQAGDEVAHHRPGTWRRGLDLPPDGEAARHRGEGTSPRERGRRRARGHRGHVPRGRDPEDARDHGQPHHLAVRHPDAGGRAHRPRAGAGRLVPDRRRAGGGPDPRERARTGLRRVRRQPAQVADGAQGHGIALREARRAGEVLDDARELPVGQQGAGRLSVHAVRHRQHRAHRRPDGRAGPGRAHGHGAGGALGPRPHEAPARRPVEDQGRGSLVARGSAPRLGDHHVPRRRRPRPRSAERACGRRRSACGRRATTRACVCRRMSAWRPRTSTASWRW